MKHTVGDDGWESKDIYLAKEGEKGYVGLHESGMTDEDGTWRRMEGWVNMYDENRKFVASVSRMFGPVETAAKEIGEDGYKEVEWP